MNKEEAVSYLQQLYPYGGHCWIDEQRIEAIDMAIKSLQEKPVSEQKLSNVQRIGKNWKESVSEIDFEQELYKAFGHVKDFTLGMQIAKRFYDMGKNSQEPVSEELEKVVEEIVDPTVLNAYGTKELARRLRNTICGTSVSEDLEEEIDNYLPTVFSKDMDGGEPRFTTWFKALRKTAIYFANWQKNHLWKPADGDDLPIIDREVIALLDNGKVVFAHRPPEFWDGNDIVTGKVTRYYPKTYGKGGWNISNVKYWLDCLMPKEIEL